MAVNLINSNDINITQTGNDIALGLTSSAVANKNVYSSTEQAIGVWTDGKTIYRKVLTGTTPNSASGSVNFNISIDTLIFDDMYVLSDSNYFTKRGYYENGAIVLSYIINKSMSVYFSNVGSSIRNKPFTLIVEYTK